MLKIDLTNFTIDNEQFVEEDDSNCYSIFDFTDANGVKGWSLKTISYNYGNDKVEIEHPTEVYTKKDLRNNKDKNIFKELFRCIWNTSNGITNFLDFDAKGVCEQNNKLTRKDFDEFFKHFTNLETAIFDNEECEVGVTISFLLHIDRDFIFNLCNIK